MRYVRVTAWPPAVDDNSFVGPPMVLIVSEEDLSVPVDDYPEHMRVETGGVMFVTSDIFEHDGELESAVMKAAERASDIEAQQAIAYHYNGRLLAHTQQVLANSGPTPLSVEETKEVLRQLADHPNYRGQRVECFVWRGDTPDEMKVVSMQDGTITEEDKR